MTEKLTKYLRQEQITEAQKLRGKMPYWQSKDRILGELRRIDRSLSNPDVILLKIATINQFYYTNLLALESMTRHIFDLHIMYNLYGKIDNVDVVKEIASLSFEKTNQLKEEAPEDSSQLSDGGSQEEVLEDPGQLPISSQEQKKNVPRQHTSFASKFAHFFIDSDNFPIYDSYAENMIVFHLRAPKRIQNPDHLYKAFCENLDRLIQWAPLSCSLEELDRYLWLAGICKELKKNSAAKVNQEVKKNFEDPEIKPLFDKLFPYF